MFEEREKHLDSLEQKCYHCTSIVHTKKGTRGEVARSLFIGCFLGGQQHKGALCCLMLCIHVVHLFRDSKVLWGSLPALQVCELQL